MNGAEDSVLVTASQLRGKEISEPLVGAALLQPRTHAAVAHRLHDRSDRPLRLGAPSPRKRGSGGGGALRLSWALRLASSVIATSRSPFGSLLRTLVNGWCASRQFFIGTFCLVGSIASSSAAIRPSIACIAQHWMGWRGGTPGST